ncbi:hypothetical protein HHK36_005363 [Tetracentron sinense]|uniref:Splicing factor U2af large subunit n=1 Tax=Tetracentron sinense TaxID=13715 RepID=A0A834ZKL3_TETSI|nr:hypothetical protein HHK36_005363 [Tetracentron sinense]
MSGYDSRYEGIGEGYSSLNSSAQTKGGDHGESLPYDEFLDRDSQHKHDSRGSDHEKLRTRDREKDRDRHHRDYKERSVRDERGRGKYGDYERQRSRDDRQRNTSLGEHVPNVQETGAFASVKLSAASLAFLVVRMNAFKRASGFDMGPPAATMLPGAAVPGHLPGVPQTMPGILPNMFPFGTTQFGSLPLMPAQAMTQQATRHARRVYVGGLPPMANEQLNRATVPTYALCRKQTIILKARVGSKFLFLVNVDIKTIATFFSGVMAAIGGNAAGPGDAVVNVYINHEKKFAFVEMRTVEEASNAMTLDGIMFEGVSVRVRRPTDYNPSLAATLGPSQPNPLLNLAAVGLTPGAIGGVEGPDRIFVGGLPYYFTEVQIKELLESFGTLRGFDLVKDRDTGNSKGYGFCIYQDPAVADIACAALNGLKMGDKTLTVRRATASSGQAKSEQDSMLAQAQQHISMQKMFLQAGGANVLGLGIAPAAAAETPTKVLCLTEVVTADELRNDEDYEEILEDMKEEGGKFGALVNVVIPRPNPNGDWTPGIGKVFLEYIETAGSANAKNALRGRSFGGNVVSAVYYPEDKYFNREYNE